MALLNTNCLIFKPNFLLEYGLSTNVLLPLICRLPFTFGMITMIELACLVSS